MTVSIVNSFSLISRLIVYYSYNINAIIAGYVSSIPFVMLYVTWAFLRIGKLDCKK